ncbi:glycosyltransferase family 4 protein [Nonomuraea soli]|uniref:UDP-GlcNAc:undecaprenyl-phosphate GlcNAc-1-phosphate transferase n=1 Tax=Nonomuraea soli TaxID=1032476 RepID=A0A7W0CLB2_9ACTN|nr:MraY family glycosyltransferase [Nonomuraea soli]MBA2893045.1 UDP-GlcNAc:undecaprenyl-phosphate GlcNAc-1-phosphate transferase [Nonomuraea soli]
MREYLYMALVAAVVTFLLVPLVRRFAIRIGAMPEVRDRDVHTTPTPRLGGLAMYGGLVAALLTTHELPHTGPVLAASNTVVALIVAGGIITFTGFLDDWWGMDPFIKMGGQIAAAGVLVYNGMRLTYIPLPRDWGPPLFLDDLSSAVITILVIVVIINAVNFVDGLDGLASGIVCISAMATWAYSIRLDQVLEDNRINVTAAVMAILIGVCLGFLPHNFHPARIFMGDTGAMLLGLVLGSSLITVTSAADPELIVDVNKFGALIPLLIPLSVLVLPLIDLVTAVVRRTSRGMSPFAPDRGHLHHLLMDLGHSHRRSVLILYAWTFLFAFGLTGMSVLGVPVIFFPLIIVLAVGVLILMAAPRWRSKGSHHAPRGPRWRRRVSPEEDDGGPPTGPMPPIRAESTALR